MSNLKALYSLAEHPCKNFNILANAVVIDPWDGREKLVLSNFTAGGIGNLIFIDTVTGEGESFRLPGDSGAWGLVNWNHEKLVVGTCPEDAFLHCFDLKTRTWAESLRAAGENYFWDMTEGSDGMIYGGTWPGCSLMRYDPKRHVLENVGRVSDNLKNLYSRYLHSGLPGYVFISYGYDRPNLKAFHLETGTFRDFGLPGYRVREVLEEFIALENEDELAFYDPQTFERITEDSGLRDRLTPRDVMLPNGKPNRVIKLAGGRLAGIRGQDYFILDHPEQTPELKRIPTEAPPTTIHTLTEDKNGTIWGCCGFGQTIFSYDPVSGASWNSSSVCDAGGEVYGMQFIDDRLFMSAYVGGDHIIYDPREPWNQLNNINPKSLQPVRPDYIRPEGRSVIGPDGGFWTGWSAKYGTYGGALSKVDPVSLEVKVWADPVPGQQVAGLTADDKYLYFTTNGGGSGLDYKNAPCHFGVWSPEGHLVHLQSFEENVRTGSAVFAAGGRVFVGAGSSIRTFNPETMSFEGDIPLEETCSWMVMLNQSALGVFSGKSLIVLNISDLSIRNVIPLPGRVRAAVANQKGELYFAVESSLYRCKPDDLIITGGMYMFNKIAVLGAGTMGSGIAQLFAQYGILVSVYDPNAGALKAAEQKINKYIEQTDRNLRYTHNLTEAVNDSDLIIEAAPENLEIKKELYRLIAPLIKKDAIVASNTSTFSLESLALHQPFADHMIITHFFNPAAIIPLVEIVQLPDTQQEIIERISQLLIDCGKVPVLLKKDIPGFIANRIQAAVMREACYLLEIGVADAAQIDTVMKEGIGMRWAQSGPFEIADKGGLDIWEKVTGHLFPYLDTRINTPDSIRDKVASGQLGEKSGKGFYEYGAIQVQD